MSNTLMRTEDFEKHSECDLLQKVACTFYRGEDVSLHDGGGYEN